MVRVLVVLVGAGLILNGLVFVFVVSQGPAPGNGASADNPGNRANPSTIHHAVTPLPRKSQIDALGRDLKTLQRDVRAMASKVNAVESSLRALARKYDADRAILARQESPPSEEPLPLEEAEEAGVDSSPVPEDSGGDAEGGDGEPDGNGGEG